jgi:hypothetical protein
MEVLRDNGEREEVTLEWEGIPINPDDSKKYKYR